MKHLSKWTLKSLTIGPQLHKTNTEFWVEALKGFPSLPRVDNVTMIYRYPEYEDYNTKFWEYMNSILSRKDLVPTLESVHVRFSSGPSHRLDMLWRNLQSSLRSIKRRGVIPCELFALRRDGRTNYPAQNRPVLE